MDETTTQSDDFSNVLESRRSEVDFLVDYSEPFYDGTDDGGL